MRYTQVLLKKKMERNEGACQVELEGGEVNEIETAKTFGFIFG